MSFIEKNKIWLLPLLGLGILGVGYMNFHTFIGGTPEPAPAAAEASPAPESAPPPAPSAPAPSVPSESSGTSSGDLWEDLQAFAVVPDKLSQDGPLKDRARLALQAELDEEPAMILEKPSAPAASAIPRKTAVSSPELVREPLPELEFLTHGSGESYAWFEGRAYRAGERVAATDYTVKRIGTTFVELSSPSGTLVKYSNSFDEKPSTPAEAP